MKDHAKADEYSFYGSDAERRTWYKFFAISLLLHVALFAAVLFMPDFGLPDRPFTPAVMNVRMVTLQSEPSGPAGPPAPKPAPKKAPPPAPKPVKKPEKQKKVRVPEKPEEVAPEPQSKPKPEVSLAPKTKKIKAKKIKPKTSLKKKTYKPEKVVKRAIRKIERQSTESTTRKIESALAQLKKKVQREGPPPTVKRAPGTGGGGGGYGGGTGGLGARALSQLDIYKAEVAYQIQKHWAFSEQLAGINKKLEAILVIKILPSGEIADIWFEKRSGNRYLDDSAYKAIKKANPLPRLPDGYLRPFYNLAVRFTPTGLR